MNKMSNKLRKKKDVKNRGEKREKNDENNSKRMKNKIELLNE